MSKDYYQVWYDDDSTHRFYGPVMNVPGKIIKAQKKLTQEEIFKKATLVDDEIVMVDRDPPTDEQKIGKIKQIITQLISVTDWVFVRHTDQQFSKNKGWTIKDPTLTDLQLKECLLYRETLRELENTLDIPNIIIEDIRPGNQDIFPEAPIIIRKK